MPSVEFPSEIKSCGDNGSISVTKCNKNLINLLDVTIFNSSCGVANLQENNCELNSINAWANIYFFIKNIEINAEHTISATFLETIASEATVGFTIYGTNEKTTAQTIKLNELYKTIKKDIRETLSVTANTQEYKYLFVRIWANYTKTPTAKGSSLIKLQNLMLEKNNKATEYVQHQGETITIPLQEEMLEGDGFVEENEKLYEEHTWGKKVLDGTENWIKATSVIENTSRFYFADNTILNSRKNSDDNIYVKSNAFKSTTFSDIYANNKTDKNLISNYNNNQNFEGRIVLRIDNNIASTVATLKTFLQEQYNAGTPVILYYRLAKSKRLPCTQEQTAILDKLEQEHLYEDITNVYSADEISPMIDVEYWTWYKGDSGVGIESITAQYYLSTSDTELINGEWKDNQDEWQEKLYIWTRSKIDWENNTTTYTIPILSTAVNSLNNSIKETTTRLAEQKMTIDGIVSEVSETKSSINTINNNIEKIDKTVSSTTQRMDNFEIAFETSTKTINNELKENSETIERMTYEFNTEDLTIAKSNDPVNARINNKGVKIYSYNELKAIFNDKGSGIQRLIVVGTAQLGNLQVVKAIDKNGQACTDFHHLVSNIQELTDLEV